MPPSALVFSIEALQGVKNTLKAAMSYLLSFAAKRFVIEMQAETP
jgi:hypothetical protein